MTFLHSHVPFERSSVDQRPEISFALYSALSTKLANVSMCSSSSLFLKADGLNAAPPKKKARTPTIFSPSCSKMAVNDKSPCGRPYMTPSQVPVSGPELGFGGEGSARRFSSVSKNLVPSPLCTVYCVTLFFSDCWPSAMTPPKFRWTRTTLFVLKLGNHRTVCRLSASVTS